ncbi:MAG: transposase [Arcticibacterium sp.]|jgi:transposase
MTRRKFTPKFKLKVVMEALKERQTLAELAQKFELSPQQISTWKREFLNNAETVFESSKKDKRSDSEIEKENLLKTIGELKVANDFLTKALR